jgi:hypothetical protein
VLRKLILGYVGHFAAKRVLEKHSLSLRPGIDVHLKLIAVPRSKMVVGSWEYMEALIRGLGKDRVGTESHWAQKATKYINILRRHILAFNSAPDDSRSSFHRIYNIFERLYSNHCREKQGETAGKADVIYFPGDKHCESILADFLLHFDPSGCKLTTEAEKQVIDELQALRRVFFHASSFTSAEV